MSRDDVTGYTFQNDSIDGGMTWSEPRQMPYWGHPAHCIALSDGRVAVVYGRRREPFGIRAAISESEGETWGDEIIVRDDFPNGNLGYPSLIEYAPGKLFSAYYGEDAEGVTCIQGTYFSV